MLACEIPIDDLGMEGKGSWVRMQDVVAHVRCICCGSDSAAFSFLKRNKDGEFPIMRCPECDCSFVWPRPDSKTMVKYYGSASYHPLSFEEVISQDSRYYPSAEVDAGRIISFCRKFSMGRRFLDAGAGFGHYSREAALRGFSVTACEPNSNSREVFFMIAGFHAEACSFDMDYVRRYKNSFDVVLLSQVLEHLVDPEAVVCGIYEVLGSGGIAAIAVPHYGSVLSRIQGERDMFISPPEHLNFYSRHGLTALFERNGFRLEYMETVSKVNKGRIKELVRIPLLSDWLWMGIYTALRFFELFGKGMVINAYFRKTSRDG